VIGTDLSPVTKISRSACLQARVFSPLVGFPALASRPQVCQVRPMPLPQSWESSSAACSEIRRRNQIALSLLRARC